MKVKRIKAFSAMSDDEFDAKFPNEKAAIDHYINIRYKGNLICPHCGSTVNIYRERTRLKVFHCNNRENSFSPFKGAIFEKTHIGIKKWLKVIRNFLNDRKGYSACHVERDLKVTYKTSWRILHKTREAMKNGETETVFEAVVEIDETYVGGKPRKGNTILDKKGNVIFKSKPDAKRGKGTKKTPVVGVKERDTGHVWAKVMEFNDEGKKWTGKQFLGIIEKTCKKGATVMSDDEHGYKILDKRSNKKKFKHFTVNHSKGRYYAGNGVHTNGIENFWSIIKRGIMGVYHQVSVKYLQRYIDEYCFRQNTRTCPNMFDMLLGQCLLVPCEGV